MQDNLAVFRDGIGLSAHPWPGKVGSIREAVRGATCEAGNSITLWRTSLTDSMHGTLRPMHEGVSVDSPEMLGIGFNAISADAAVDGIVEDVIAGPVA